MQYDVDPIRRAIGWYMLQTKFQSASHKIHNQRPVQIAVAISTHDRDSRPNHTKLIENGFRANISEMPDFIGALGDFFHPFRQVIVRVREHENARLLVCSFQVRHIWFCRILFAPQSAGALTPVLLTKRISTATLHYSRRRGIILAHGH
jgi:hypothetical protein